MREALRAMFATIARLFTLVDKSTEVVEHYVNWAEKEANAFEQLNDIELEARITERCKELGVDQVPDGLSDITAYRSVGS
jgi:hypothetical protein